MFETLPECVFGDPQVEILPHVNFGLVLWIVGKTMG